MTHMQLPPAACSSSEAPLVLAHSPHSATCRYTEALPTQAFLAAMEEDDEIEVELSPNQNVIIKFKAVGELQPNGTREVGPVVATAKSSATLGRMWSCA